MAYAGKRKNWQRNQKLKKLRGRPPSPDKLQNIVRTAAQQALRDTVLAALREVLSTHFITHELKRLHEQTDLARDPFRLNEDERFALSEALEKKLGLDVLFVDAQDDELEVLPSQVFKWVNACVEQLQAKL